MKNDSRMTFGWKGTISLCQHNPTVECDSLRCLVKNVVILYSYHSRKCHVNVKKNKLFKLMTWGYHSHIVIMLSQERGWDDRTDALIFRGVSVTSNLFLFAPIPEGMKREEKKEIRLIPGVLQPCQCIAKKNRNIVGVALCAISFLSGMDFLIFPLLHSEEKVHPFGSCERISFSIFPLYLISPSSCFPHFSCFVSSSRSSFLSSVFFYVT